jgi:hypothetical protein
MRTEVIGVLEALGPDEQHLQRPVHHAPLLALPPHKPLSLACGTNERRRRQVDPNLWLPFIRVWLPASHGGGDMARMAISFARPPPVPRRQGGRGLKPKHTLPALVGLVSRVSGFFQSGLGNATGPPKLGRVRKIVREL